MLVGWRLTVTRQWLDRDSLESEGRVPSQVASHEARVTSQVGSQKKVTRVATRVRVASRESTALIQIFVANELSCNIKMWYLTAWCIGFLSLRHVSYTRTPGAKIIFIIYALLTALQCLPLTIIFAVCSQSGDGHRRICCHYLELALTDLTWGVRTVDLWFFCSRRAVTKFSI
jgi:hypothetical protein